MADTMYALAVEVAEGRLSADEAAPRMAKLGTWVTQEEYADPDAQAERFHDDLPIAGDNSFVRVTALYMSGKLTPAQYKTLKGAFGLTFKDDEGADEAEEDQDTQE